MKKLILSIGLLALSFAGETEAKVVYTQEQKEAIFIKQLKTDSLIEQKEGKFIEDVKIADVDYYVLYYSASWCHPCRQFTPILNSFYKEHYGKSKKTFEIILMSNDDSEKEMKEYMKKTNMPFKAAPYETSTFQLAYEVYPLKYLPSLVVLDGKGNVVASDVGQGDKDVYDVLKELEELLK